MDILGRYFLCIMAVVNREKSSLPDGYNAHVALEVAAFKNPSTSTILQHEFSNVVTIIQEYFGNVRHYVVIHDDTKILLDETDSPGVSSFKNSSEPQQQYDSAV